ncbi:hypothetical protein [Kamptonema formosum]|nr:hypothetical protein [Oscillatoria sp. PCC 10802]
MNIAIPFPCESLTPRAFLLSYSLKAAGFNRLDITRSLKRLGRVFFP